MPPTGDDPCVATDSVSASPPASPRWAPTSSTWPTLIELIGQTGHYDYVEFTAEYAPFDMHDLDHMGRALELADVGGMIKVEQSQPLHQTMRHRIRIPERALRRRAHGRGGGRLRTCGAGRGAALGWFARCRHATRRRDDA